MTDVEVYFDDELVGHLNVGEGIRPVVEFRYDQSWLGRPHAFGIDPELSLSSAPFTRTGSLFGAFRDAAPDEWGRGLLARSNPDRFLGESDYLLGVSDETRQGALRFRDAGGHWLTEQSKVPVLVDLPRLRAAAERSENDAKAQVPGLEGRGRRSLSRSIRNCGSQSSVAGAMKYRLSLRSMSLPAWHVAPGLK